MEFDHEWPWVKTFKKFLRFVSVSGPNLCFGLVRVPAKERNSRRLGYPLQKENLAESWLAQHAKAKKIIRAFSRYLTVMA